MSENVKAIVRKIDPTDKKITDEWTDDFIGDIVRNEGKIVTLYNYHTDEYDTSYKLISENGVLWHQEGRGTGKGCWTGSESPEKTDLLFMIIKTEPIKLDDDLFTI